jgi:hypothetical protein
LVQHQLLTLPGHICFCSKHCKDDYHKQEQQEVRKRVFSPLAPRGTQYPPVPAFAYGGKEGNGRTRDPGLSVSRIPPCVCGKRDRMRKRWHASRGAARSSGTCAKEFSCRVANRSPNGRRLCIPMFGGPSLLAMVLASPSYCY